MNNRIAKQGGAAGVARPSLPERCLRFLDGYSEYRDRRLGAGDRSFFVDHMGRCASCRRYDRVIRRGVRVLREPMEAPAGARMSIAEVRCRATALERESLALGTAGSGVTLSAAVVVALLLAVVAWSPFLSGTTPETRAPPVVAGAPPSTRAPTFAPLERSAPPGGNPRGRWDGARSVLPEPGSGRAAESGANPELD